jgi:uncharacterized membrane protein
MSDWFYAANNEQKGPINESELKADLAAHKLPGDTLVWKDGMDAWTPANQVPAFTFRAAPAPAAVQPPPTPTSISSVTAPSAPKVVAASPEVNNPDSTKPLGIDDIKGMMGKPESLEVDAEDADKNKIFGILAYLGILVFVPIVAAPESPFARYHSNQGLVLFLGWFVLWAIQFVVAIILSMLPAFLGFLGAVFGLLYLAPLALLIYGIINAAAGKCVPLPVIGGIKILGPVVPKSE